MLLSDCPPSGYVRLEDSNWYFKLKSQQHVIVNTLGKDGRYSSKKYPYAELVWDDQTKDYVLGYHLIKIPVAAGPQPMINCKVLEYRDTHP